MVVDLCRWVADGSGGWRLSSPTNGSLSGMAPFTKVIGLDLRGPLALSTGRRYGRALPVPVSAIAPGTDFSALVDFDAFVTRLSSVIAGPFAFKTRFPAHHTKREGIAHICSN
jgi:hypothetical protein